jgi:hypothetical protein
MIIPLGTVSNRIRRNGGKLQYNMKFDHFVRISHKFETKKQRKATKRYIKKKKHESSHKDHKKEVQMGVSNYCKMTLEISVVTYYQYTYMSLQNTIVRKS